MALDFPLLPVNGQVFRSGNKAWQWSDSTGAWVAISIPAYEYSVSIATSGNWNSTYTTVCANSADWSDHTDLTDIIATSGDWNSTYTTVCANSARWESTYTTLQDVSGNWVTYTVDDISPANWVIDSNNLQDTGFLDGSPQKVPTQRSVKFYVDSIVTGVNNLKGGYNVLTDTPSITNGIGVLQGDTYYVTVGGLFYGDQLLDPGDLIIATIDNADTLNEWIIVNRNLQDELIDRWESNYTTVQTESAGWDSHADLSELQAPSGDWNSTYTTVQGNSGTWDDQADLTDLVAASGDWNSTYTTVQTESAGWDSHADLTDIIATSGDWNSTYSTVEANSGEWADHADLSELQATSGDWNSTYTTVQDESAGWGVTSNDFCDAVVYMKELSSCPGTDTISISANINLNGYSLSGVGPSSISFSDGVSFGSQDVLDWQDAANGYVTVQAKSGFWESTYTTVRDNSATWDDQAGLSELQAASGDWNSTYTTVQDNSAAWGGDFCNDVILFKELSSCPGTDTISISANINLNGYSLSGISNEEGLNFESGAKISSNAAGDTIIDTNSVIIASLDTNDYSKTDMFRSSLIAGTNTTPTFEIGTGPALLNAKFQITYATGSKSSMVEVFVGNFNGNIKATVYAELNHDDGDKILSNIEAAVDFGGVLNIISTVNEPCTMVANSVASYISI